MIAIQADGLVAVIDEDHGAEVLELAGPGGARPLGRPPFAPAPPAIGDLDEETWTASYRGGWQFAAPNAGNACDVEGDHHGFHGHASTAAWAVVERAPDEIVLEVVSHGLRFRRRFRVQGGALRVETTATGEQDRAPLIAVEHLVCGINLLDPAFELSVGGGRSFELDETTGPTEIPAPAPPFPAVLGLDGRQLPGATWSISDSRALFFAIGDLAEGWAAIRNPASGEALRLKWDLSVLPYLWIWHESGSTGGPWRNRGHMLGVEPSMTPHSLGLERALSAGQARVLGNGESLSWWVEVTPVAPVSSSGGFLDGALGRP